MDARTDRAHPADLANYANKLANAHKDEVAKMAEYDVKVGDMTSWKK